MDGVRRGKVLRKGIDATNAKELLASDVNS
jgi:hypothetical protein